MIFGVLMTVSERGIEDRLDRIERLVEVISQQTEVNSQTIARISHQVEVNSQTIARISHQVEVNERRWQQQEVENRIILDRIDAYQRASNQVVNLAFTLVGAATVALVGIVLRLAISL